MSPTEAHDDLVHLGTTTGFTVRCTLDSLPGIYAQRYSAGWDFYGIAFFGFTKVEHFHHMITPEVRREIAPYVGVNWTQRYGAAADFARDEGGSASEANVVFGIRLWR